MIDEGLKATILEQIKSVKLPDSVVLDWQNINLLTNKFNI
jgi:hypothetical protein